jgi:ATP-dependent DNA helicase RecG
LANSFAHAMYGSRTNHEICIHPSMITIYSPGDYASRYKPEEYIKGNVESEIRNATISKILYLSKYIEQFGSGFKRIDSLCKDSGIKYSYENKDNGFKFIIGTTAQKRNLPETSKYSLVAIAEKKTIKEPAGSFSSSSQS